MRLLIRLPLIVLLLLGVVVLAPAHADSGSDSQFVSATNSARGAHGLGRYAVAADLTSMARRWAAHMATHRQLAHNPSYASQACCWTALAENVGVGSTVSQIQRAFMNSSEHRANILSRTYTQVGIGTARGSDGRLYVDEVFRRPTNAGSARTASSAHTASAPRRAAPAKVDSGKAAPASRGADRASRSALRRPRVVAHPRRPQAAPLTARLAAAQRAAAPGYADPVGGAVAYVRVVEALTSTGH